MPTPAPLLVLLAACDGAADITTDPRECRDGYRRGADGLCYQLDADADTDSDADTDTDTDVDTAPADLDGDGYGVDDCDDGDATVHPGAPELGWDGTDQDCDGADLHDWLDLAIGCGIDSTGAARCWGSYAAEYGLDVVRPGPYRRIVSGGTWACALDGVGAVTCWGDAPELPPGAWLDLQVGAGVTSTGGLWSAEADRVGVELPLAGYRQASGGDGYLCAVDAAQALACWDLDIPEVDQLGQAAPPSGPFVAVGAGNTHACGLRSDGSIACWGDGREGQLDAPAGAYVAISTADRTSCAVSAAGEVACWGRDTGGVTAPPAGAFVRAVCGGDLACGIRADGTATCWGYDSRGLADIP